MNRSLSVLAFVVFTLSAESAYAHPLVNLPENDVSVGFGQAWMFHGDDSGLVLSIDFTYMPTFIFWASGGAKVLMHDGEAGLFPYVEGGAWFGGNIGLGYSVRAAGQGGARHNAHIFVGIPIPITDVRHLGMVFVEPYYRPCFAFGDEFSVGHEVGLLIKVTTFDL